MYTYCNRETILKNILFLFLLILIIVNKINCKSIIFANYYNVILYYPSEYGGNDDIRVVFDVRNVTTGTFKYIPIIVDVAYDTYQNIAYCYLESAVRSYIILLKWFGGKWCYQIMFDFESSTYSNYMYHSLVTLDNFVYWTSDRYVMSGRIPGYEQRRLMQPGWERIYRMTIDKPNKILYVASFDFGENVIYSCSISRYSCIKILTTSFSINSIFYDGQSTKLYVGSIQVQNLYYYSENDKSLKQTNIKTSVSDMVILNDYLGVFTNRESISVCKDIRLPNCIRLTRPRLVDPYALQYVFTFDHVSDFSNYPYPDVGFQDILWKDKQYLFHLHILGADYVENDYAFLPEMDLNNNFLRIDSCANIFFDTRLKILVPSLIAGGAILFVLMVAILICICKSKRCGCCGNKKRNNMEKKVNNNNNKLLFTNAASTLSGSTVPLQQMSTNEKFKPKSKLKQMRIQQPNIQVDNYMNSKLNLNDPRRNDMNKTHSSGLYIIGKSPKKLNYSESEASTATESYLNPGYTTRIKSKTPDKSFIDKYQLFGSLPRSIDSKKNYYKPQAIGNQQKINTTSPARTRYISTCHIPLYGSTNTKNCINIKKAADVKNGINFTNFPSLSEEDDSYNMMLV